MCVFLSRTACKFLFQKQTGILFQEQNFKHGLEYLFQEKSGRFDFKNNWRFIFYEQIGSFVLITDLNIAQEQTWSFLGRESKKNGVVLNKYSILVFQRTLYTLYSLSIVQLYSV